MSVGLIEDKEFLEVRKEENTTSCGDGMDRTSHIRPDTIGNRGARRKTTTKHQCGDKGWCCHCCVYFPCCSIVASVREFGNIVAS